MAPLDPYLCLAEHTRFVDYFPNFQASDTWFDVILEVAEGVDEPKLQSQAQGELLVNAAHLEAGSRFVTVRLQSDALDHLRASPLVERVELAEPLRHQRTLWPRDGALGRIPNGVTPGPLPVHSETLSAIIDDGCPFAHREFRKKKSTETRIVTIWDMDTKPELDFPDSGAPQGFFRGREVPQDKLNAWIKKNTRDDVVHESACYRDAGYTAVAPELTHGSHLLGRLAGTSYARGKNDPASKTDIAFVQLPRRAIEAPDAGSMHAHILDGLRYLRGFAQRNGYKRCVVACAKGSQLGPHDGQSLFDRALDQLLEPDGTMTFDFVLAAGNGYEDDVHAILTPTPGSPATVHWVLPAFNEVATFAELWLDDPAGQVTISVRAQEEEHELEEGEVAAWGPWLTAVRVGRQVVLRAAPTLVSDGVTDAATPGRVAIVARAVGPATIHGYLCWGGRNIGAARETRQARWRVPDGSANAVLKGDGTLLGDGCGSSKALHVVGGYVGGAATGRPKRASYSAAGPTRGTRVGPDFLALSEQNSAMRGVPGPGTLSGIIHNVWGTSVAAPQAARAIINKEHLPDGLPASKDVGSGYLEEETVGKGFLA